MLERLPERMKTPKVARAITSPSGVLLAGAGMSVAVLAGLPVVAAAAIGLGAWAVRVAASIPRKQRVDRIDLKGLNPPWRQYVQDAMRAAANFEGAVKSTRPGPLHDRLATVAQRMADGVRECARVARTGQSLDGALMHIDPGRVQRELADCDQLPPSPSTDRTKAALQAQLATAKRIHDVQSDTHSRLRLLNAQLDEAVAQAVELSVKGADVDVGPLTNNVDSVVGELEALRQGLEEAGGGTAVAAGS